MATAQTTVPISVMNYSCWDFRTHLILILFGRRQCWEKLQHAPTLAIELETESIAAGVFFLFLTPESEQNFLLTEPGTNDKFFRKKIHSSRLIKFWRSGAGIKAGAKNSHFPTLVDGQSWDLDYDYPQVQLNFSSVFFKIFTQFLNWRDFQLPAEKGSKSRIL